MTTKNKKMVSYRLSLDAIEKIRQIAALERVTITSVLESAIDARYQASIELASKPLLAVNND